MTDIIPGTMAYKAEVLRAGKLVARVNGRCVRTMDDLHRALENPEMRGQTPFLSVETRKRQRVVFRVEDVLAEQDDKTRGPNPLWPAPLEENLVPVRRLLEGAARAAAGARARAPLSRRAGGPS